MVQGRTGKDGGDSLKRIRQLTAPLSAVFLIVIAGFAFTQLQARTEYPPPILDPEFNLWVSSPELGGMKPMVWELEYQKSAGDQISLQEVVAGDKKALRIQIFQDGADENFTYVRLGQVVDGARVRALFDEEVGITVLPQGSCACSGPASGPSGLFEIETNDGTHTLDFLFADTTAKIGVSPTHRTILLQTTAGEWTHHLIDLAEQYENAQWKSPDRISLSIIFGVPGSAGGWHGEYVHGFSVTKRTTNSLGQQDEIAASLRVTGSRGTLPEIDLCPTLSLETQLSLIKPPCISTSSPSQRFNL